MNEQVLIVGAGEAGVLQKRMKPELLNSYLLF